jgi:DNA-binding MarR family transcriptional regulator
MNQTAKKKEASTQMIDKTNANHLESLVSFRLRLLANLYTKASASAYERGFGLTLNEWRVIALLSAGGKLSISRLADQAQFDRGLTTRVIATLIKHQFVKKERDTQDGRGEIASLTVQGQALVSEVTPLATQRNEELLSCLTKNERAIFEGILNKLTDQAKVMLQNEKVAQLGTYTKYEVTKNVG